MVKGNLKKIGVTLGNKLDSSLNLKVNKKCIPSKYYIDPADHLCVKRYQPLSYMHHGLYLGLGLVIHYDFKQICIVTLEDFAKGERIYLMDSEVTYPKAVVMARAASRLGEEKYHLMVNNCEHFVRWCRNGKDINLR